jgi:hypothetical protein
MRVSGAASGRDGVFVALWSGSCRDQSGDLAGGESSVHLMSSSSCSARTSVVLLRRLRDGLKASPKHVLACRATVEVVDIFN